jgi:hypothetical protein
MLSAIDATGQAPQDYEERPARMGCRRRRALRSGATLSQGQRYMGKLVKAVGLSIKHVPTNGGFLQKTRVHSTNGVFPVM